MTRRGTLALALPLGLLALVLAGAVALVARGGSVAARPPGRPVAVATSLAPRFARFGDPVEARATVRVDAWRVDPRSVRLQLDAAPYLLADASRTVVRAGRLAVVTIVGRLECLGLACLPARDQLVVVPRHAFVAYELDGHPARTAVRWPSLTLRTRLTRGEALRVHTLAAPTPVDGPLVYRRSPRLVGAALLAAAGFFALLAAAGAVALLRPVVERRRRRRHDPFARLLAELAHGEAAQRRRALSDLAAAVEPFDPLLGLEGRLIAWGPAEPTDAALAGLAARFDEAARR